MSTDLSTTSNFRSTPQGNGKIHLRVRTIPHGVMEDKFYTIKQAEECLSIWEKDPPSWGWDVDALEEFRLALEMEKANV